ncbi:hypothetical protein [Brenneria izadpanahii]|nr:hypothetical protein [Brenneria izadpanahii]
MKRIDLNSELGARAGVRRRWMLINSDAAKAAIKTVRTELETRA